MRTTRLIAVLAMVCFFAAACNKSGSNTNTASNTNKPAAANTNKPATTSAGNTGAAKDFKPAAFAPKGGNLCVIGDAGLQFEIPQGWQQTNQNGYLGIASADGSVAIIFMVVEAENLTQVMANLSQGLDNAMDDVKAEGEPQEEDQNGLKIYSQEGTGTTGGTPIQWSAAVIIAPKKPVVALATYEPGRGEAHAAEIQTFIHSLKPAADTE